MNPRTEILKSAPSLDAFACLLTESSDESVISFHDVQVLFFISLRDDIISTLSQILSRQLDSTTSSPPSTTQHLLFLSMLTSVMSKRDDTDDSWTFQRVTKSLSMDCAPTKLIECLKSSTLPTMQALIRVDSHLWLLLLLFL